MREFSVTFQIAVLGIIFLILCLWFNNIKVKTVTNYKREIVYRDDNISDEALRAYGRQMANRCPTNFNEWTLKLVDQGYMVKTEAYKK